MNNGNNTNNSMFENMIKGSKKETEKNIEVQNEVNNSVIQNEINTLNSIKPANTLDLTSKSSDDVIIKNDSNLEEVKEEVNTINLTNTNIDSSIISKQDKEINTINLNNVATPIGVNEVANKDEYKEYIIHRSNSKTLFFIMLILICIVAILFIVAYLYMPEYNNKHKYVVNDKTTTNDISDFVYITKKLAKGNIKGDHTYKINKNFTLKTEVFNNEINVFVNDVNITSLKKLYGTVSTLDDLIIFAGDDKDARTAKIFVVDKTGKLIKQIESSDTKEARIVNGSIKMDLEAITFTTIKVDGINLYSNNEVYNVCDKDLEEKAHIDKNFVIENTYELVYDKNHEFKELKSINNKTLDAYLKQSKVCR